MQRVIVIGGGISGLAAALRLATSGASVTVLEAGRRLGGKLRTGAVAGIAVDLGAESMLARRGEGVDLAREAGLGDALRPPEKVSAAIWSRGELCPMPQGHVMGVPGDPEALRGLLSEEGVARAREDERLPRTGGGTQGGEALGDEAHRGETRGDGFPDDLAFGEYVAARLGPEVVDRLVEPLLGGVYAGDAYRISMRAAVPQLYAAARDSASLLAGVRALQARAPRQPDGTPVFMGVDGGIGRLPGAVADACRAAGGTVRTGVAATKLHRGADGWHVVTDGGEALAADAVVLALPAPRAARLLAAEAPAAAAELDSVEYASMALVTMAFRRADLPADMPGGSGFLVPPVDGRGIKAATFSSNKWGWVAAQDPGLFVLRTSVGRYGEEAVLEHEDDELVELSLRDLRAATGLGARPVDRVVSRWTGGLPQYPVGHTARVDRIRAAVARVPGLAVCGAVYEGVGIPACVASGRRAADGILAAGARAPGAGARRGAEDGAQEWTP